MNPDDALADWLEALAGPNPACAGGMASMLAGAAGAALCAKCRDTEARAVVRRLLRLSREDGAAYAEFIQARRSGQGVESALRRITQVPLEAAEACLGVLECSPPGCPKSMLADLAAGHRLLHTAAHNCLALAQANLSLLATPWPEGRCQHQSLGNRLEQWSSPG